MLNPMAPIVCMMRYCVLGSISNNMTLEQLLLYLAIARFHPAQQESAAAATYHLCIDSSALGVEATTDFIETFVRRKLEI